MVQKVHADEKRLVEAAAGKMVELVRAPALLEHPTHFHHLGMIGSGHLLVHLGKRDALQSLPHLAEHHDSGNEGRTCHLLVRSPSSGLPAGPLDAFWAAHTD